MHCVYGMFTVYTHSCTCVLCTRTRVFVHCVYTLVYSCGMCPVYTNRVHTFDNVYLSTPHSHRRFGASARRMRAILRGQWYVCSFVCSYVFLCVHVCSYVSNLVCAVLVCMFICVFLCVPMCLISNVRGLIQIDRWICMHVCIGCVCI
jgi:hypothetical protein